MAKTTAPPSKDERVQIFIPMEVGGTDPNFIVVLNGKNYVIPKGTTQMVPKGVAREYERSRKAYYKQNENKKALLREASKTLEQKLAEANT